MQIGYYFKLSFRNPQISFRNLQILKFFNLRLKILIHAEFRHTSCFLVSHARFAVGTNPLLKKVGLVLQGNHIHPLVRVDNIVDAIVVNGRHHVISYVLHVLAHARLVHANQVDGQALRHKLALNLDCALYHLPHALGIRLIDQVLIEEQAAKHGVQTLVARNQLIAKAQSVHLVSLPKVKDGRKARREENVLDNNECQNASAKVCCAAIHELLAPLCFFPQRRVRIYRTEQLSSLCGVRNQRLDHHGVHFIVDALHEGLHSVEAFRLANLHLLAKVAVQIIKHDAIRCREKRKDVTDVVLFAIIQSLKVFSIISQVYLFHGPKS